MNLFKSRRFWVMVLATGSTLALHFFPNPEVKFVIDTITPLAMLLIAAYTVDDALVALKDLLVVKMMQKYTPQEFYLLFKEITDKQDAKG